MQQANVLAKVAYAFESDMDVSDLEDDRETIFSSVDLLSPAGQTDAQTLALMLQEQLDAINNEIRYHLERDSMRMCARGFLCLEVFFNVDFIHYIQHFCFLFASVRQ